MAKRDEIRAKTVAAAKKFQSERVTVDGMEVEVRQPTVAERGLILDSAGSIDPENPKRVKVDIAKLQVNAVIACCYVSGTDEKVFEEADRDSFLAQPASRGGWFDELSTAAQRLLNVDLDDAKKA